MLAEKAGRLAQAGKLNEANALYTQLLRQSPEHPEALCFMGVQALNAGHITQSKVYFQRALKRAPQDAMSWKNLALAQGMQGAFDQALASLDRALQASPLFPAAMLEKGVILEQLGRAEEALHTCLRALAQADQVGLGQNANLPPRLSAMLQRAQAITQAARKAWILETLKPLRDRHGNKALERVDYCLDSHFGSSPERPRKKLHYPTFLYFPGLPEQGWFNHRDFPWLERIESRTQAIRRELGTVLGEGNEGFRPFVEIPEDQAGAAYWRAVNQSADWNAFFFYRDGERNEDNCRRCPVTAEALDSIPISRVAEHSPEAFFSVLKPGVRIPRHTGVVNIRLVTHLPLLIPPDCGIRVNGEARGWNEGECIVFDDTFEHEAWNGSGTTRVVLIFDIWNPWLTAVEQQAMRTVIEGFSNFRHAHED